MADVTDPESSNRPRRRGKLIAAIVVALLSSPSLDGSRREIDWSKAHHAFFTGPRDFAVDHQGTKLRFRFNGFGWKLHALDLELPATRSQE